MKLNRMIKGLLLTTCLGASLLLAGCGGSATSTPSQQQNKEITVMIPDWGAPSPELLEEFKNESGITVHVQTTSWDDTKSKVSVASAAKKAPADVIEVDWSWAGEFSSAGWLEPQHPDEATVQDVPTYSYFKYKDGYCATPYINGVRLAYYNHAMAQKAGVTTAPQTTAELDAALKAMKGQGIVQYPYLFPMDAEEKVTTSFVSLAFSRNGKVFNDDGTLNRESTLDTLTLLKRYLDEGLIDPNTVTKPGLDTFRGIYTGEGAFLLGPTSFATSTNDPKVSKVVGQVTPIPMPTEKGPAPQTVAFVEALGISAYSQNKEAAQKFIDWYTSKETQLKMNSNIAQSINIAPTRISTIAEMAKGNDANAANAKVTMEQLKLVKNPFPLGVPKYYTKMSAEIYNIISEMGKGQLTAQEATDKMLEKVDAIVKANQ